MNDTAEKGEFRYELHGDPDACANVDPIIRRALLAAGCTPPPLPRRLHLVPPLPPEPARYAGHDEPLPLDGA